ncbi:hypothetical protein XELAEV_18032851mg [Xenopus laevis]|uniref:Uncharacterized protein n=1 Tax=Xenopus laevis TaxID=8355 RepID=A0A974CJ76_XENLA|nr:hypothetical protein XELAEV_18032851mg [Xenopus laevis]
MGGKELKHSLPKVEEEKASIAIPYHTVNTPRQRRLETFVMLLSMEFKCANLNLSYLINFEVAEVEIWCNADKEIY